MKRLTRNHSIFAIDKQNPPVLYVDSGGRFIVETEDCFCHQIVESDDVLNDNFDYSYNKTGDGCTRSIIR